MPWWGWLLIAWVAVAVVVGVWWAAALANAEVQDQARQVLEDDAERPTGSRRRRRRG